MTRHTQFDRRQFDDALSHLIAVVTQGKACVKIARELGGFLHGNPDINNLAPVFWGESGSAIALVAQLWAFKLFDGNSKLTVPCLVVHASRLRTQFSNATPDQVDAIVDSAGRKIDGMPTKARGQIKSKRDKVIAHLDQRLITDPAKIAPDMVVAWSDVLFELEIGASILRDLSEGFRGTTPSYELAGADDYKRVLDAVMHFLS
jgi:hypothetical protein